MGLDLVEFIMATEAAFGVEITDAQASTIATPRQLIAYLRARLPAAAEEPCLTQQAFYRVRDSLAAQTAQPRAALRPSTALEAVFPDGTRRDVWRPWGRTLGVETWPSLPGTGWFGRRSRRELPTLGAVARHLATWAPAAVKRGRGWTDHEIERGVVALIEADLGVDMARYTLDAEFVRDLRVD
jgi:acyl carrier protein